MADQPWQDPWGDDVRDVDPAFDSLKNRLLKHSQEKTKMSEYNPVPEYDDNPGWTWLMNNTRKNPEPQEQVIKLADPKGIGGVSAVYIVTSHDRSESLTLVNQNDAEVVAKFLAGFTEDRWDVIENKTTHQTVAAFEIKDSFA